MYCLWYLSKLQGYDRMFRYAVETLYPNIFKTIFSKKKLVMFLKCRLISVCKKKQKETQDITSFANFVFHNVLFRYGTVDKSWNIWDCKSTFSNVYAYQSITVLLWWQMYVKGRAMQTRYQVELLPFAATGKCMCFFIQIWINLKLG